MQSANVGGAATKDFEFAFVDLHLVIELRFTQVLVVGLRRTGLRCLLCIQGDLGLGDGSVSLCPHFCNACLAFLKLELLGCHLCLHLLYRIWLCRRDLIRRCQVFIHIEDALLLEDLLQHRAWRFGSAYIGCEGRVLS